MTKGCRHVSPTKGSARQTARKLGIQMQPLKREQLLHDFFFHSFLFLMSQKPGFLGLQILSRGKEDTSRNP